MHRLDGDGKTNAQPLYQRVLSRMLKKHGNSMWYAHIFFVVICFLRIFTQQNRKRLLKELAARLKRDTQLRYTQRELEMQRLLAGKGGRRKLRGVEEVGAENDEDEDEMDDAAASKASKVDEKNYKPRVYKWRIERKR